MAPKVAREPVHEPIVASPTDSFIWRQDDYPLPWSVWNAHPECEIHLIRNAEGTCHIGDYVGSFTAGDLFITGRGLAHNWVTPLAQGEVIEGRDLLIQFDEDRILRTANEWPELASLKPFLIAARRGMVFEGETRMAGGQLMEAIGEVRGVERLSLFLQLLHVLSSSKERRLLSSENFAPNSDLNSHRAIRDVLSWMAENCADNIRLADPAARIGMTETSFSRFFKRHTGTTFSRYLSELRIAKACQALDRTDLAITAVASEVGYDNLSNFNRAFRLLRGMPPSQYRAIRRKIQN